MVTSVNVPDWSTAVETVAPYVVQIATRKGRGTGFLFAYSNEMCGIATAAHVIDEAYWWEQPIRIRHEASGESVILRHGEGRGIFPNPDADSAAIVFQKGILPFPAEVLPMFEETKYLRIGNPVGWLGFPAIAPSSLCFFRGTASAYLTGSKSYLVDGVAINGVSGGPAFVAIRSQPHLIGLVTAYIANRQAGEALPGLCEFRDLTHLHHVLRDLKSLDEAKDKEEEKRKASTEVRCLHCGATGVSDGGRAPEQWRALAIGHLDCPKCIAPCDGGRVV